MKLPYKIIWLIVFFSSCKEEFEPSTISGKKNLLVVEGFINTGGEATIIKLTRTTDLKDVESLNPEAGAVLSIEGQNGYLLNATSNNNGLCTLETRNIDPTQSYRLRIKTLNGTEYLSDFLENKNSPELTVGFNKGKGEVGIYIETEDPTKNSNYFSWTYEETWEIHSKFESKLEAINNTIVSRDPSVNINRCWKTSSSTKILIASAEGLSEPKIRQFPLLFLSSGSEKVKVIYKIKVFQYSLTKGAYTYLSKMKKSTEDIGTIFDPQPTELKGNIHCVTNPAETVIGFLNATSPSEKILYVTREMMPPEDPEVIVKSACKEISIAGGSEVFSFLSKGFLITSGSIQSNMFKVAPTDCVDCRRFGTNIKPYNWPQ